MEQPTQIRANYRQYERVFTTTRSSRGRPSGGGGSKVRPHQERDGEVAAQDEQPPKRGRRDARILCVGSGTLGGVFVSLDTAEHLKQADVGLVDLVVLPYAEVPAE